MKHDNYSYVDLGLPSGTLWAMMNVGAETETDYGKYFAWGTKDGCYASQVTTEMFTREWYEAQEKADWGSHVFEDGSVAPSLEQIQELMNNCDYAFITYRGVKGGMLTSRINGNSIFLPAAGVCIDGSQYATGEGGDFWSRSLSSIDHQSAWDMLFGNVGIERDYGDRYFGLSVRGVLNGSSI